jgi:hypothetical protein
LKVPDQSYAFAFEIKHLELDDLAAPINSLGECKKVKIYRTLGKVRVNSQVEYFRFRIDWLTKIVPLGLGS